MKLLSRALVLSLAVVLIVPATGEAQRTQKPGTTREALDRDYRQAYGGHRRGHDVSGGW